MKLIRERCCAQSGPSPSAELCSFDPDEISIFSRCFELYGGFNYTADFSFSFNIWMPTIRALANCGNSNSNTWAVSEQA